MRGLKFSLILGSCLALSGCSSIWSGVADFAGYMSDKTEFLSLRKSKTAGEHVANTVPNDQGLVRSSAGYYAPTGWESSGQSYAHTTPSTPSMSHASYTTGSMESCPAGSYLTAQNTCMVQETSGYQMTELRGYSGYNSSAQTSSSGLTDCPSGTYLTAENTCMQSSSGGFSSMPETHTASMSTSVSTGFSLERLGQSLTGPIICPEGMILVGAHDCRFSDSQMTPAPFERTSATSYAYEIACPVGSYKDPDNVCMRDKYMP